MRELVCVDDKMVVNDELIPVTVEGFVYYHVDINYGADADGNRGVKRISIDHIDDVAVFDKDGEEYDLTEDQKEYYENELGKEFLGL